MSEYKIQYLHHRNRDDNESLYSRRLAGYCEIIFLQQGTGETEIDGRVYIIKNGDIVVINSSTRHSDIYRSCEGALNYYVVGISDVLRMIEDNENPVVNIYQQENLHRLFQILEEEYRTRGKHWEDVCSGVLRSLIALIKRHLQVKVYEKEEKVLHSEALTREIVLYIKAHYCESLTLQSVADIFFISPYYLAHLMKKYLGISMIKYIIRLRMGEAQNLLHDTDYPIKQIALMLGYENINYFNNVFEKNVGMPPGAYRKQSRQQLI